METRNKQKKINTKKKSLNRTMQYGNKMKRAKMNEKTVKFKSYYVVWKPGGLAAAN